MKCVSKSCNKWFCNNRHQPCGSDIIIHLVKSKHKEVVLHPESSQGEAMLECYVCGSKNIFALGCDYSRLRPHQAVRGQPGHHHLQNAQPELEGRQRAAEGLQRLAAADRGEADRQLGRQDFAGSSHESFYSQKGRACWPWSRSASWRRSGRSTRV